MENKKMTVGELFNFIEEYNPEAMKVIDKVAGDLLKKNGYRGKNLGAIKKQLDKDNKGLHFAYDYKGVNFIGWWELWTYNEKNEKVEKLDVSEKFKLVFKEAKADV